MEIFFERCVVPQHFLENMCHTPTNYPKYVLSPNTMCSGLSVGLFMTGPLFLFSSFERILCDLINSWPVYTAFPASWLVDSRSILCTYKPRLHRLSETLARNRNISYSFDEKYHLYSDVRRGRGYVSDPGHTGEGLKIPIFTGCPLWMSPYLPNFGGTHVHDFFHYKKQATMTKRLIS